MVASSLGRQPASQTAIHTHNIYEGNMLGGLKKKSAPSAALHMSQCDESGL
jgi:hypothetical protein